MADKKEKKSKKQEQAQAAAEALQGYIPRIATEYKERIIPEMIKQFGYKNIMQVPKIEKIVLNMGCGEGSRDAKIIDAIKENMATIAGQQPVITRAKKSIANFKLREGMPVGCKVTLRRDKMYDFLDRLVNVSVPRIRDFRGLPPKAFDGRGNYALGVKEQLIFAEINYDSIPRIQGLDIIIVTSAKTDEEALALLKLFGMPFRN
jgi:large subunit ribosomal protein L5